MSARALIRPATAISALLLGFAVSPSLADTRAVTDPVKETRALERNGRLDIVRATASHAGARLKHTVSVRSRIDPKRGHERPLIAINTRGSGISKPEYLVFGPALFRTTNQDPVAIGDAALQHTKRRWIYRFDPDQIRHLGTYGWAAVTTKGRALDVAPAARYAIHHA